MNQCGGRGASGSISCRRKGSAVSASGECEAFLLAGTSPCMSAGRPGAPPQHPYLQRARQAPPASAPTRPPLPGVYAQGLPFLLCAACHGALT